MEVDNVFASIGFEPDEATIMALRSDVARIVRSATDGLRQRDAARKLNIAQGDLSKIRNGRTDGVSLELLIRLCVKLGISCKAQWGKSPDSAFASSTKEHHAGYVLSTVFASGYDPNPGQVNFQVISCASDITESNLNG